MWWAIVIGGSFTSELLSWFWFWVRWDATVVKSTSVSHSVTHIFTSCHINARIFDPLQSERRKVVWKCEMPLKWGGKHSQWKLKTKWNLCCITMSQIDWILSSHLKEKWKIQDVFELIPPGWINLSRILSKCGSAQNQHPVKANFRYWKFPVKNIWCSNFENIPILIPVIITWIIN